MGQGLGHGQHVRELQQYLEYIGEVPEVEDVMKLNGRGKERRCDFLVQGCYRREAHRFLRTLNGLRKCRA